MYGRNRLISDSVCEKRPSVVIRFDIYGNLQR